MNKNEKEMMNGMENKENWKMVDTAMCSIDIMEQLMKDIKEKEMNNKNKDYDIKMDGEFHQFEGGGIRYTKTGKGRFDLIPKDVVINILATVRKIFEKQSNICKLNTISAVEEAYRNNYELAVISIVNLVYGGESGILNNEQFMTAFSKMLIDLAIHYEKGAEKYGENNWKKGIPAKSFRDSGLRHLSQWISGATDEPHHISAIWNFFGLIYLSNNSEENENFNDSLHEYLCRTLISNYFPPNTNSTVEMNQLMMYGYNRDDEIEVSVNRHLNPVQWVIIGTVKGIPFRYLFSAPVFAVDKDHEAMKTFKNAFTDKFSTRYL